MNLTDLFENKKEIKNRNPVAQELRANPQFKSKTEIDKKKEVKKGYQKYKGKVEEASGYQGQSEPTYHVFKNADIKKIVDTIKAKNLRAYPEQTADGVKVHTFDLDRSAVAKELGINETLAESDDTTYVKMVIQKYPQEWKKFLDTGDLMDAPNIYEKLFVYFHFDTGEMPYGTAKARDGDPYVWIADKLADLGLAESTNETMDTEYNEVKAILDKHGITKADDIELGTPAYEELFGYYMDSGEMPYGVMKARTGMPDEWIWNRVQELGLVTESENANNLQNESIKKTDYDNMLNIANRNKDNDIARMQKLAGIVPMQMQEDYAKMTHELISKLIKDGKSDQEIQARTGEAGKRIEAIRKSMEDDAMDRAQQAYKLARDEDPAEATQDLARGLNSVKPSVDTTMSPQLTAKGFDAIAKGDRLTPTQIKAVEPYVSKLSKAISNPQTAGAVKTAFNKVR